MDSKKDSKKLEHHHSSKKMGSNQSTPVAANAATDFPTAGGKSCVIVLVQQGSSLPQPTSQDAAVATDKQQNNQSSLSSSSSSSVAQVYETWWKNQIVAVCTPVASSVHIFEVNTLLTFNDKKSPTNEMSAALAEQVAKLQPAAIIATHMSQYPLLGLALQLTHGACFTIMADETVSKSGELRLFGTDNYGTHMASHVPTHIGQTLKILCGVPPISDRRGTYDCPYCATEKLTQVEIWHHCSIFHINIKDKHANAECPICKSVVQNSGLFVHIHDDHAPAGTHLDQRAEIKLYSFGLCVIRRKSDGRFLCCVEYSNAGLWLPGGGIDGGELPWKGAERECLEEAGVAVDIKGVLRVEVSPSSHHHRGRGGYCRMRYIFYGEPKDENDCEPKTFPDFESQGACWVTLEELAKCRLRGYEPAVWFKAVSDGCPVYPMSLFGLEGDDEP